VIQIDGIRRNFTPVYVEEDYSPVALARKLKWYTSPATSSNGDFDYSEGFVNAYRDIATHAATSSYRTIFRHILERPDEPLVFHCTAGKDRTGVLGAMILKLCGVDDETICWEYSITEPGLGDWRELFIKRISRGGLGGGGGNVEAGKTEVVSHEEASRITGSRAENMRAWLRDVLEAEFGGVKRYLTEKCEFTEQEVERLRQNLVVEVKEGQTVTKPTGIPGWSGDAKAGESKEKEGGGMGLDTSAGREKEEKVMVG